MIYDIMLYHISSNDPMKIQLKYTVFLLLLLFFLFFFELTTNLVVFRYVTLQLTIIYEQSSTLSISLSTARKF